MRWMEKLKLRLRSLFRRPDVDRELDNELRFHLEQQMEENMAGGMTPEDARYAARRSIGGSAQIKEECRDMRRVNHIEILLQDVRYGLRMMRRNPGFTAIAILILALGIGANSAIFSVVNAVLLRPLPYPDSHRLVQIWETNPRANRWGQWVSFPDFTDWRRQNRTFEDMAAIRPWVWKITGGDNPEVLFGFLVTSNLFSVLRTQPMIGRSFQPGEDQPGHDPVVILSYGLWKRRFAADPRLVGQAVTLDGQKHTVVGIMPPVFDFPKDIGAPSVPDIWVAFGAHPERDERGSHNFYVFGRLKPGITAEQAKANMESIAVSIGEHDPEHRGRSVRLLSLQRNATREVRPALLLLVGAVGLVLLIACVNIANLQLARATTRRRETATRQALGASHARLVRQLLTESVLISLVGGAAGLLSAAWGTSILIKLGPDIPRLQETTIDPRVAGFTLLLSLGTGILFGLVPAFQGSKTDLNQALKEASTKSTAAGLRVRTRNLLVVAEMALTLMVLIGATLVIRSFVFLENVDVGFDPHNVLTALLGSSETDPSRSVAFFKEVVERIEALPGVLAAGVASAAPLRQNDNGPFEIEGQPPSQPGDTVVYAERPKITPGYFRAMGIRLLKGREFSWADNSYALPVAIVSEALVRQYWPNEDPIGKRLSIDFAVWRKVVGIMKDTKHDSLEEPFRPVIYVPLAQSPFDFPFLVLAVRARGDPGGLSTAVRQAVKSVRKDQPLFLVETMEQLISDSLSRRRFQTLLLGIFAAVALTLAAVGIYAVVSFAVTQRTHEMAIRIALGARYTEVVAIVLRQGLLLALSGAAIGLISSLALSRMLSGLLYGVTATDALTFTVIPCVLMGVALFACYVPARRAARVDPMVALRYE